MHITFFRCIILQHQCHFICPFPFIKVPWFHSPQPGCLLTGNIFWGEDWKFGQHLLILQVYSYLAKRNHHWLAWVLRYWICRIIFKASDFLLYYHSKTNGDIIFCYFIIFLIFICLENWELKFMHIFKSHYSLVFMIQLWLLSRQLSIYNTSPSQIYLMHVLIICQQYLFIPTYFFSFLGLFSILQSRAKSVMGYSENLTELMPHQEHFMQLDSYSGLKEIYIHLNR